jgi:hypothetical protein
MSWIDWIDDPPDWLYNEDRHGWRERAFHRIWNFKQWFWCHGGYPICRLFMHQYRNSAEHFVEDEDHEVFVTCGRCMRCGNEVGLFGTSKQPRCKDYNGNFTCLKKEN